MKLTRKLLVEILTAAIAEIEKRDRELWEIVVVILRRSADSIQKAHE